MNTLRPFFLLIQRPLVLFGAIGWMIIATFLLGTVVSRGGDPDTYMAPGFLAVVVLCVYTGWLIGACILELQQSSFICTLPGHRTRLIPGFLLFGLFTVLFAVLLVRAISPSPQDGAMLFALGSGAYALGGSIRDPESGLMTSLGVMLLLVLLFTSGTQARIAAEYPLLMFMLVAILFAVSLYRLFNRQVFRRRSLHPGRRVLAFSIEKIRKSEGSRTAGLGPRKTHWKVGYLGQSTLAWARAAWYETYGGRSAKAAARAFAGSWGLILVLLLEAQEGSEQIGLWKSLCWTVHDAIMRSPYSPEYGEGGAFFMVSVLIVILGGIMAVFRPVALAERMLYPLSRRQKANVLFAGGLLDMAIFLLLVAPLLFLLGHASGWVLGIEPRLDYMPLNFRAILITLIMMPFAYWGGLQIRSATWQNDPYSMVGISLGLSVFSIVTGVLVVLATLAAVFFKSPLLELLVLLSLLLLSRLLYKRRLESYYRTADLA